MSINKTIARHASVIGGFTFLSRVLGFIRDVVIARMFGTGMHSQAFVVAFRIPNLLRDMVAEGAVNAAFVPVFSEYAAKKSREEFWHLANCLLNILLVILAALTILGVVFSPWIVRLIAPGFSSDTVKFQETVRLTRIIYPYLLLVALSAYSMGILNSLKHFSLPAFAPCLLNISIIVFALFCGEGTLGLALGVLAGGVLQLAAQIPMLYKKGFRWRPALELRHPGISQIRKLLLPRIFSSCVYQLNLFVDTMLGSLAHIVGQGAISALYFANRVFQFPLGIFGIAIAQAALPSLSCQALEDNLDNFKKTLNFSLIAVFLIMLPVSALMVALSRPIIEALFQGGRFDAYSAEITSGALLFYALSLSFYCANKVLVSGFFSLKDTMTPLKITAASLLVNIVFNLILMYPLKLRGLALATSLSGFINFFILFYCLRKKIGPLNGRYLSRVLAKILFSSLIASACGLYVYARCLVSVPPLLRLSAAGLSGLLVFVLGALILDLAEIKKVIQWVLRKNERLKV